MRFPALALLILPLVTYAQAPGTCAPGVAEGVLDANNVRATVFNGGNLFFGNEVRSGDGYLVPKTTGHSPVFTVGLWVGGQVDGEIRVAGSRYTNFEYWPGPLEPGATLPSPADCTPYDRIFVVSRADVEHYLQTGEATDDLRDWPVAWGAPVLDGDGDPNNYDLAAGDQPAIYGDQTAWWVMNDVGNVHEETGSDPLGIEVQATAFASERGPVQIQQATYYRYRIRNRSDNVIDSAYVALWSDPDLGNAVDDYTGSDTTRSMGFVYNGDNDDEGSSGYGVPPAHGYKVVRGPVGLPNGRDDDGDGAVDEAGERLGMTAFTFVCGGCTLPALNDPVAKEHYYNRMQGRWNDGTPLTEFGVGYQTEGPVTTFAFPGDPITQAFWSEFCPEPGCERNPNPVGDRRLVVSTGPFRLGPGEETEVVFGFPFAQGTGHLDSVAKLRLAAESVQAGWDTGALAPTRVEAAAVPPEVPGAVEIERPRPNPFTDRLTIRYTLPDAMPARVTLLDVLGREVAVLASGEQSAGPHEVEVDTATLPAGVYLVRFEAGTEARTFPVVKAR